MVRCREVVDHVLPAQLCRELIFIHNSVAAVGYRPHVYSATITDIAVTEPGLLIPLIAAREVVRNVVEKCLSLELQLFVEFTGLISWTAGSSIGWHYDANKPYLQQRHAAAVLYLNTGAGTDFIGGNFRFRDGDPSVVEPRAGRLVCYTADERNVHMVEPVLSGERCTLTMWFTLQADHNEDTSLLPRLHDGQPLGLPEPMYEVRETGQDIRTVRLAALGLHASGASVAKPSVNSEAGQSKSLSSTEVEGCRINDSNCDSEAHRDKRARGCSAADTQAAAGIPAGCLEPQECGGTARVVVDAHANPTDVDHSHVDKLSSASQCCIVISETQNRSGDVPSAHTIHFHSQEAVFAAHFHAWKLEEAECCALRASEPIVPHNQGTELAESRKPCDLANCMPHLEAGCTKCEQAKGLQRAATEWASYRDKLRALYKQLLPEWRSCDAIFPPK